jgi:hypothetical protein
MTAKKQRVAFASNYEKKSLSYLIGNLNSFLAKIRFGIIIA